MLREASAPRVWKAVKELTPEGRRRLALFLINQRRREKDKPPINPSTPLTVEVVEEGSAEKLKVAVGRTTYSFSPNEISQALSSLVPREELSEANLLKAVEAFDKEGHTAVQESREGGLSTTVVFGEGIEVVPTLTGKWGQETVSSRYSLQGSISTKGSLSTTSVEVGGGVNALSVYQEIYDRERGVLQGRLALVQGPLSVGFILSNPYLKPYNIFSSVWKKLSLKGYVGFSVGPFSLSFSRAISFQLSWTALGVQFFMWAFLPTMIEYGKRFGEGKPWYIAWPVGTAVGLVAGGAVALWRTLGFARGWREMQRVKEGGLKGFFKKVWAFASGTVKGLFSNAFTFLKQQAFSLITGAVEMFYFFHHLLGIRGRGKPLRNSEDYLVRMREIREEMGKGMYLKAAKDIEGLIPYAPPYLQGELEAYHEFALEQAKKKGLYVLFDVVTLGFVGRRHRQRKREREKKALEIIKRAEEGKATPEEIQWALGYLSAKLYNPFASPPLGPSMYMPLSPFEELSYEQAVWGIYVLSKETPKKVSPKEDPAFYHTVASNVGALLNCCIPPEQRVYAEAALRNLMSVRKDVVASSKTMVRSSLERSSPMSLILGTKKSVLFLQYLALMSPPYSKEDRAYLSSFAEKNPDVVEEAYDTLYKQYKEAWKAFQKGELSLVELLTTYQQLAALHSAFISVLTYLPSEKRKDFNLWDKAEELHFALLYTLAPFALDSRSQAGISNYFKKYGRIFSLSPEERKAYEDMALSLITSYLLTLPPSKGRETAERMKEAMDALGVVCERCQQLFKDLERATSAEWFSTLARYA